MPYAMASVPPPEQPANRTSVQHLEVSQDEAGQRLDNYLQKQLAGVPRSRIFRVIRKGEVRVNSKRAAPELRLQLGDRVRVPPVRIEAPPDPGRPGLPLQQAIGRAIVYEDERLLALDKPAGIAVHGGSGVSFGVIEALRALRPQEYLELVHRLDRDTSGCLLVARRPAALRTLHALLREGAVEKRYLTLVRGQWSLGAKRIDVPLRTDTRVGGERTVRVAPSGKASVSDFRPVQFFGRIATLMEVTLRTGRTHQIRVHAAHAGHPVAGDDKYGDADFNAEMGALGLHRMFLHSHSVSFSWPQGADFSVNTPLPAELGAVIETLAARPRRSARGNARNTRRPAGRGG